MLSRNSALVAALRTGRSSAWPARLDVMQSVSGLLLALFMWAHMLFVSSILLGADAMWTVSKFFEGYFFFDRSYPGIVALVVAVVIALFVMHGVLAMRKVPHDYRQLRAFHEHRLQLRHGDTTSWWLQVVTGLALLVLAAPHLFQMLMHPGTIDPYQSADRVWSGRWWPLYLTLLIAVEVHGGVGLYRLAVKWTPVGGRRAPRTHRRLKMLKWSLTLFFIALGLATLAAYMKIGLEHSDRAGEVYVPGAASLERLP